MSFSGISFSGIANSLARRRGESGRALDGVPEPTRLTVTADDGVELYVEVQEAPGAAVTVVFCHGYLLNSTAWNAQRAMLAGKVRMVFWDNRGHGRSGWATPPNATLDQLGRDLYEVIRATTPRGKVILIGHSMGGMAILALAGSHPELFGNRVGGVLLSSTSAGGLSTVTVGLPQVTARMMHRLLPVTLTTLGRHARFIDGARRSASGVSYLIAWPYLYGSRVPRPVAKITARLMASVPMPVIAEFYGELIRYDLHAVLPALGQVPVVIMVGERDLITPRSHADELVSGIPGARLVEIPEAGHLLVLERPQEVAEQVSKLVTRVVSAKINGQVARTPRITGKRIEKPVRDRHRS